MKQLSDEDLLYLLEQVVSTERQINAEIEFRAQLDPHWPADIVVKAGYIYRGYIPVLPDKPATTTIINQEFLSELEDLL